MYEQIENNEEDERELQCEGEECSEEEEAEESEEEEDVEEFKHNSEEMEDPFCKVPIFKRVLGKFDLVFRLCSTELGVKEVRGTVRTTEAFDSVGSIHGHLVPRRRSFDFHDCCDSVNQDVYDIGTILFNGSGRPRPPLLGKVGRAAHSGGFLYIDRVAVQASQRGNDLGLYLVDGLLEYLAGKWTLAAIFPVGEPPFNIDPENEKTARISAKVLDPFRKQRLVATSKIARHFARLGFVQVDTNYWVLEAELRLGSRCVIADTGEKHLDGKCGVIASDVVHASGELAVSLKTSAACLWVKPENVRRAGAENAKAKADVASLHINMDIPWDLSLDCHHLCMLVACWTPKTGRLSPSEARHIATFLAVIPNQPNLTDQELVHLIRDLQGDRSNQIHAAVAKGASIERGSAIHHAVAINDVSVVKLLLELRGNVHAKDDHGNTPLHVAAGMCLIEQVNVLLEAGASKAAIDENGRTPAELVSAKIQNRQDLAKQFLGGELVGMDIEEMARMRLVQFLLYT